MRDNRNIHPICPSRELLGFRPSVITHGVGRFGSWSWLKDQKKKIAITVGCGVFNIPSINVIGIANTPKKERHIITKTKTKYLQEERFIETKMYVS